jgi:hypothetical protein
MELSQLAEFLPRCPWTQPFKIVVPRSMRPCWPTAYTGLAGGGIGP